MRRMQWHRFNLPTNCADCSLRSLGPRLKPGVIIIQPLQGFKILTMSGYVRWPENLARAGVGLWEEG